MRLVADLVLCLLACRSVVPEAVGLDNQAELRPEEVHAETIHSLLSQRPGKASAVSDPQKSSLKLRIGEPEGPLIKHRAQRRDTLAAAMPIHLGPQHLGIDQPEFVRFVDGALELGVGQLRAQIDEGAAWRGDRYSMPTGSVGLR